MKIVDESILFFSLKIFSKSSLHFMGIRGIYTCVRMECEDLASRLDWVASSSCELTKWPVWTFCPVVLQLAWRFSFFACFTPVHRLAACLSRATCEIQSRVPASVHSFKHFFTLFHTIPLHDSHINTGFLNAELQANWHRIKPTKLLIKFNITIGVKENHNGLCRRLWVWQSLTLKGNG